MSHPLFVPIVLAGLLSALNPSNAQVAEGEKSQDFDYLFEGQLKQGTCRILTEDIGDGQKMEFVRIRKGKFMMGSPKDEQGRASCENQHEVELTQDFYLGKFAVTQAQYKAIAGEKPSDYKGEKIPVYYGSWDEAVKYCEALSKKLNRKVTLPTEAQWEYACRAGTKTPFHFGSKLNGDLANCNGNFPYGTEVKGPFKDKPTEVGSYPANPWGLYDMHGNVLQWCQDYFDTYEKVEGKRDPVQVVKQDFNARVIRGGSCFNDAQYCRSAYRYGSANDGRGYYIGFRICIAIEK